MKLIDRSASACGLRRQQHISGCRPSVPHSLTSSSSAVGCSYKLVAGSKVKTLQATQRPLAAAAAGAAAPPPPAAAVAAAVTQDAQPSTSGRTHQPTSSFQPSRHSSYDSCGRLMLKNLTYEELEAWCVSMGEPPRRAEQIWRWMYYKHPYISSFQEAVGTQNGFSAAFAAAAGQVASLEGGLQLEEVVAAADGTTKLVLKLTEGEGRGSSVEAVLIPAQHRSQGKLRLTLCVSSQVGCAMNCQFCYTGRMGLAANLSTAQIVEQMVVALRVLREREGAELDAITNVVFMGMGEPLHNLDSVLAAVEVMTHPRGLGMSHNKVTVSTVGLVPELQRFEASSCQAQLAVSLHATSDEVRDWIVPVNRRHKLVDLMALLAQHYPRAAGSKGRRVLIEYTMLSGVNDTPEDAERLLTLLEPVHAKVNLIQFNAYAGTRFQPSSLDTMLAFRSTLVAAGRVCTIRASRGDDQMAACGQLGDPVGPDVKGAPLLPVPERFQAALLGAGPGQ